MREKFLAQEHSAVPGPELVPRLLELKIRVGEGGFGWIETTKKQMK